MDRSVCRGANDNYISTRYTQQIYVQKNWIKSVIIMKHESGLMQLFDANDNYWATDSNVK